LLQEILQEVKGTRGDVQILSEHVDKLEKRMSRFEDRLSNFEKRVSSIEGRVTNMEERLSALEEDMTTVKERLASVENSIVALDEKISEIKAISEAIHYGQEALIAKYDSLSLDVHVLKGKATHLTNVLEDKVLPLLHDHESGMQVLNNRVF
jgi:chromosome segregation ATPase